jgi:hypothetical protein
MRSCVVILLALSVGPSACTRATRPAAVEPTWLPSVDVPPPPLDAPVEDRVRSIAQIFVRGGVIEVMAKTIDGVHIGLANGVWTSNCGISPIQARTWASRARVVADTNVAVAKNEVVVLHFDTLCAIDFTRDASGRGGSFRLVSSTDYGAGSIVMQPDRKQFGRFLSAITEASTAARAMGVADTGRTHW